MADVILYNPRNGKPIVDSEDGPKPFLWNDGEWEPIGVNEMKKYPEDVAIELLKRYSFLQKVNPEDVEKIKELMTKEILNCEYCEYQTTDEKKMKGHMIGKHKVSEKTKETISNIPSAKGRPTGKVLRRVANPTPEQMEGIPDTSKGEVGGWYGAGLEEDAPSGGMGVSRPGQPGHFSAS